MAPHFYQLGLCAVYFHKQEMFAHSVAIGLLPGARSRATLACAMLGSSPRALRSSRPTLAGMPVTLHRRHVRKRGASCG